MSGCRSVDDRTRRPLSAGDRVAMDSEGRGVAGGDRMTNSRLRPLRSAYNSFMTGRAPGRIHGDDLIGEVLRNMEEGVVRIGGKSLVPSIYRIYLSPDDFEPFRNV